MLQGIPPAQIEARESTNYRSIKFNLWPKPFFSPAHLQQSGSPRMENSTFVPNPLASPALMVLASTAENRDGARVPTTHPYPVQNLDKEMNVVYSNNSFGVYRPGDPFPPPLYAPMPPFVRPNIERSMGLINASGGSAFRPVATVGDTAENFQSAFTPAKRGKLDSKFKTQPGDDENDEPLNFSDPHKVDNEFKRLSPVIKEERPSSISSSICDTNSETPSEGGEFDRETPDSEARNLRKARKRNTADGQMPCCPVCGITLRTGEMDSHLGLELDKLEKLIRCGRKSRDSTPQGKKTLPSPSSSRKEKDSPNPEVLSHSRYDTYVRIRCNRQARLSARSRNKKRRTAEDAACPICNEKLFGSPEELNAHVEQCLKKKGDEDETVDVEGDCEQYEEYTWAGQTRIRATSMLEGGFARSGFQTANTKNILDDDQDLNVDGDETEQYGPSQYSEVDVIPCSMDDEDVGRQALRGAVLGSPQDHISTCNDVTCMEADSVGTMTTDNFCDRDGERDNPSAEIIEALKFRLKETVAPKQDKHKCLICMESYANPLASIQCWHVHCEECWLKTLGAKKLCPQCNMITSPSDLRRIYL